VTVISQQCKRLLSGCSFMAHASPSRPLPCPALPCPALGLRCAVWCSDVRVLRCSSCASPGRCSPGTTSSSPATQPMSPSSCTSCRDGPPHSESLPPPIPLPPCCSTPLYTVAFHPTHRTFSQNGGSRRRAGTVQVTSHMGFALPWVLRAHSPTPLPLVPLPAQGLVEHQRL